MNAKEMKEYLLRVCQKLGAVALPLAAMGALGMSACDEEDDNNNSLYAGPPACDGTKGYATEKCGQCDVEHPDCSNPRCAGLEVCEANALYAAPDCNSAADCSKAECKDLPLCQRKAECDVNAPDCSDPACADVDACQISLYAGPPCNSIEDCGKAECKDEPICKQEAKCDEVNPDCSDPACADVDACQISLYAGPPCNSVEDCSKDECKDEPMCKQESDCDAQNPDCSDPACAEHEACEAMPAYAAPCATEDDCSRPECAVLEMCQEPVQDCDSEEEPCEMNAAYAGPPVP